MTGFIQNLIWNQVEGFVEAGKRTVGGYAGDALIKAGDAIENSGRSVGGGMSSPLFFFLYNIFLPPTVETMATSTTLRRWPNEIITPFQHVYDLHLSITH